MVVLVPLWEDAHAKLIERTRLQRSQRLFLQFFALVYPRVAGCSEGKIGSSVGVAKVIYVTNANWSVIPCPRCDRLKFAFLSFQRSHVAVSYVGPLTERVWHEPNLKHALTIVETVDHHLAGADPKRRR